MIQNGELAPAYLCKSEKAARNAARIAQQQIRSQRKTQVYDRHENCS